MMWSKEAERNQLRKIEDLINETEPGSYIRMAFAGCVRMAEENIENDFANNYPEIVESRDKTIAELRGKITANELDLKLMAEDLDRAGKREENLEKQKDEAEKMIREIANENDKLAQDVAHRDIEIDKLNAEIMKLKAKLYDYMMKGAE